MERMKAERLRAEYLDEPLGIDVVRPRLGWIATSGRRGAAQSGYRILAASRRELLDDDKNDLWDSGKIHGFKTQQIEYGGRELSSEQRVYWKVRVWDEAGAEGPWSETASWTMGLLGREEWGGSWIGRVCDVKPTKEKPKPSVYLRGGFRVRSGMTRATVYATARGLYRLWLNGERVGRDVFSPEWTDYHVRVQYQTYDVTALLAEGDNAAGAVLGQGWYSGYIGMFGFQKYGMDPSFLMQLNIEYEDGTRESVVTDESWLASYGPIVSSDLQMGETVDARLEMPGWHCAGPGFEGRGDWAPADVLHDYGGWLVAQMSRTIRETEELSPRSVRRLPDGRTLIDFGQNMAGWLRVGLRGAAGTAVVFRFGEALDGAGELYADNLRFARQTDVYVCRGSAVPAEGDSDEAGEAWEAFEPTFTYHGFRYVEVGAGEFELGDARAIVVHSDLTAAGELETSHPLVNRLIGNIRWTQRANFMSVPTDCPQRDERHGWTGDAQIFSGTAAYNMDVSAFFSKWLVDLEDAQRPTGAFTDFAPFVFGPKGEYGNDFTYTHTASAGWADAPIIVAWKLYETYGDERVLRKHYEAMKKWVEFNRRLHPDGIRRDVPQYGDWLSVNERPFEEVVAEFGRMVSHHSTTPYDIFSTAYMAYNAKLMANIAGVLGEEDDRAAFGERFESVRTAFVQAFVDAEGRIKGDTQTAYAMALEMDLLPRELRAAAFRRLTDKIAQAGDMATTGFLGTKFLMDALVREGRDDLAFRLLLREEYPSWLYSVRQGATTIWERWDGWTKEKGFQDPGMNSFSHFAFGSVGEWLYRNVGGIGSEPSVPGFGSLIVRPRPLGGLSFARCRYETPHGTASTEWRIESGKFLLDLVVPVNATALVYVPSAENSKVLEGDSPVGLAIGVQELDRDEGCRVYRVVSGSYRFESLLTAT